MYVAQRDKNSEKRVSLKFCFTFCIFMAPACETFQNSPAKKSLFTTFCTIVRFLFPIILNPSCAIFYFYYPTFFVANFSNFTLFAL